MKTWAITLASASLLHSVSAAHLPEGVVTPPVEERIVHYTFPSAALKKPMAFNVVFPQGYAATGKPWPVLFFLHGLGRNEKTLIEEPRERSEAL